MEYCCHVWAGAPSCYLEFLDKLLKLTCCTVVPSLAAFLERFALCQNVASLIICWMGDLSKNIQLMLAFLKATLLVQYFSYYPLITFLMMLSVTLLSMLMLLVSYLSVIRYMGGDNK